MYYQGWDRRLLNRQPQKFATIKYEDKDNNSFFDQLSYDLDGDTTFENVVELKDLGINDKCNLIDVSHYIYKDYVGLQQNILNDHWNLSLNKKPLLFVIDNQQENVLRYLSY